MTYDEITDKVYLDGNVEEEETHLLLKEDKFEIYGTTRTIDKQDYYVTIYLDGITKYGPIDENSKITRISLKGPYYVQYDRKLTRKERDIFANYMSNNWDHVLWELSGNYEIFNKVVKYNGSCPDYNLLDIED